MKTLLLAAACAVALLSPARADELVTRASAFHMLNDYDRCYPGVVLPETLDMVTLMYNMMDASAKRAGAASWQETRGKLGNDEKLICMMLEVTGKQPVADLNRIAQNLKRKVGSR